MKRAVPFAAVLASFALVACAPENLDVRPPKAPAPIEGVTWSHHYFPGRRGTQLFEESWRPASTEPRATLVIHHGLKSYADHYGPLAAKLVKLGFSVRAYDMRGHGHSAGMRATLDDFDDLVGDLSDFVERVRKEEGNRPVFVMGHSVGGAVVSTYVVTERPRVAGVVLLAPALRVDRAPIEAGATPLAGTLFPNLGVVDVPNELFSRSPEIVAEMDRDPLVYQPKGPARTAVALIRALEKVWAGVDTIDVPLLAMHGTADRATDPRGSAEIVRRARAADKKLILYRGLVHDLVREPEREQVMEDITAWLNERAPR